MEALAPAPLSPLEACAASAVAMALGVRASAIVVLSETGLSARLVAKYRPRMPVLTITHSAHTARVVRGIMRGVHARSVGSATRLVRSVQTLIGLGVATCREQGWCCEGDLVVVLRATATNVSHGSEMPSRGVFVVQVPPSLGSRL